MLEPSKVEHGPCSRSAAHEKRAPKGVGKRKEKSGSKRMRRDCRKIFLKGGKVGKGRETPFLYGCRVLMVPTWFL